MHRKYIIEKIVNDILKALGFDDIYFSVAELIEIQKSNDPFTISELKNILEDELERPIDEMNTDVIDYILTQI